MERIEGLIADLDAIGGPARAKARELLTAVLDLHRSGLRRVMEIASSQQDELSADPLVSSLLVLYDLHPRDLRERVGAAVEAARSELEGCAIEVIAVSLEDRVARVRLDRAGGYHRPAEEVRAALRERILAAAPDLEELSLEGTVEPARAETRLVPLGRV
jgi:hypothetical protein